MLSLKEGEHLAAAGGSTSCPKAEPRERLFTSPFLMAGEETHEKQRYGLKSQEGVLALLSCWLPAGCMPWIPTSISAAQNLSSVPCSHGFEKVRKHLKKQGQMHCIASIRLQTAEMRRLSAEDCTAGMQWVALH